MQAALIAIVKVYRFAVSPLIGPCCRFHPTCSEYAIGAIRRFGPLRGAEGRPLPPLAPGRIRSGSGRAAIR